MVRVVIAADDAASRKRVCDVACGEFAAASSVVGGAAHHVRPCVLCPPTQYMVLHVFCAHPHNINTPKYAVYKFDASRKPDMRYEVVVAQVPLTCPSPARRCALEVADTEGAAPTT